MNAQLIEGKEGKTGMSEIAFLASPKPFNIPDEIKEYNNRPAFKREEDII